MKTILLASALLLTNCSHRKTVELPLYFESDDALNEWIQENTWIEAERESLTAPDLKDRDSVELEVLPLEYDA